jgi:hypothetical protein
MINNQLKIYKKRGLWLGEKTYLKKKKGLNRVLSSRPGHGSTRFCCVFIYPGILSYPDWSNYQV